MSAKKALKLSIGIGVAAIFVWLIFRRIDIHEVGAVFKTTSLPWVGAALLAFFAGYSCRIERWRQMLRVDNPELRWSDCAGPLLASVAANNVLPLRAGDLLRAFGFKRRLGIDAATSLASLFVERLLDLLMVATILGVVLLCFGLQASRLFGAGSVLLIGGAVVILLVLLAPSLFRPLALLAGRLVTRIAPKWGAAVQHQAEKGFAILEHTSRGPTMGKLVFWSVLAWVSEGFLFLFGALALQPIGHPLGAWLALPLGTLATIIPSTPGFVGTFDYFIVRAMTMLGNTPIAATAYAILIHALLWLPPTLVGGVYLMLRPIRKQDRWETLEP